MSEMRGWAGKILRVDLTKGEISNIDTSKYVPKYLGGIGVAYRIAWEEIPKGTKAFDPENMLLMMVGPITGTAVPCSGRAEIVGIGAQGYPEQLVCSGIGGGRWPAKLKYNGYDGIVIQGKSPSPVYLLIRNGVPELLSAGHLWGICTKDIGKEFAKIYGKDVDSWSIGPAGENLVRFATIQSQTARAAGQGGFGAVMGSKNLKAVCVVGGNCKVSVARPEEILDLRAEIQPVKWKNPIQTIDAPDDPNMAWYIKNYSNMPYRYRRVACSQSCIGGVLNAEHIEVPAVTHPGTITGELACMAPRIIQYQNNYHERPLGFRGGFESQQMVNQLGLNELEIVEGTVPWLVMGKGIGLNIEEILGFPVEETSPYWWAKLLNMIAYRRDFGDQLAEGLYRTIQVLGKEEYGDSIYTGEDPRPGAKPWDAPIDHQGGWGYVSRNFQWEFPLPLLITSGLKWLLDTRDPHHDKWFDPGSPQSQSMFAEEDIYSSEIPLDISSYSIKRGHLISSLTSCWSFPLRETLIPLGWPSLRQDAEAIFLSAVTGIDYTEKELDKVGDRINNLFRAFCIRNHDRTAQMEWLRC